MADDKLGEDGIAVRCNRLLIVFHNRRGLELF